MQSKVPTLPKVGTFSPCMPLNPLLYHPSRNFCAQIKQRWNYSRKRKILGHTSVVTTEDEYDKEAIQDVQKNTRRDVCYCGETSVGIGSVSTSISVYGAKSAEV